MAKTARNSDPMKRYLKVKPLKASVKNLGIEPETLNGKTGAGALKAA